MKANIAFRVDGKHPTDIVILKTPKTETVMRAACVIELVTNEGWTDNPNIQIGRIVGELLYNGIGDAKPIEVTSRFTKFNNIMGLGFWSYNIDRDEWNLPNEDPDRWYTLLDMVKEVNLRKRTIGRKTNLATAL